MSQKQQLIEIFMLQAPSVLQYYRQLIKSLVLQAIVEYRKRRESARKAALARWKRKKDAEG